MVDAVVEGETILGGMGLYLVRSLPLIWVPVIPDSDLLVYIIAPRFASSAYTPFLVSVNRGDSHVVTS